MLAPAAAALSLEPSIPHKFAQSRQTFAQEPMLYCSQRFLRGRLVWVHCREFKLAFIVRHHCALLNVARSRNDWQKLRGLLGLALYLSEGRVSHV